MNERRLTFWEATSVMVGAGVGAGIMAVPYLPTRPASRRCWCCWPSPTRPTASST